MIINEKPYWWDAKSPTNSPDIPWETKADIVIVGCGFTGLGAAIPLARAGYNVVILEKNNLGEGAATRNGGITSGNLRPSNTDLIRRFGPEKAKNFQKEAITARHDLYDFIEHEKLDCDFDMVGRFLGNPSDGSLDQLKREADQFYKDFGIETQVSDSKGVKDYIDSPKYKAGVFRPDIGGIHPSKLLHEMIRIALRDNVKIFSHTASQSIKRVGQTFTIPTHRGSVTAEHVIVATNAYTGKEFSWLRRRLIPVISEIIATEELGENFVSHLMPRKTMFAEALELGYYYRPSPDGKRILLGGRRLGANSEKARERLRTGLVGILPQLKDTAITHHWLGNVAFPFDQLPKIAVNDGVIYPAGFCGSGTVWARWLGQKAAGMIIGKDAETVFFGDRFWTLPFYNGDPWFLPITMNYYKLRDKLSSKST